VPPARTELPSAPSARRTESGWVARDPRRQLCASPPGQPGLPGTGPRRQPPRPPRLAFSTPAAFGECRRPRRRRRARPGRWGPGRVGARPGAPARRERRILLGTSQDTHRRKSLRKKALGLIQSPFRSDPGPGARPSNVPDPGCLRHFGGVCGKRSGMRSRCTLRQRGLRIVHLANAAPSCASRGVLRSERRLSSLHPLTHNTAPEPTTLCGRAATTNTAAAPYGLRSGRAAGNGFVGHLLRIIFRPVLTANGRARSRWGRSCGHFSRRRPCAESPASDLQARPWHAIRCM
jgi:hypothetical protein